MPKKRTSIEAVAERAVEAIVKDLRDRRGLKHEWYQIDAEIQQEIKDAWKRIIVAEAKKS